MTPIHIRFLRYSAFYSPLLLMIGAGHLKAEGLEATCDVTGPGRPIPDGIRDGTVQVAQSALAVSFAPALAGQALPFVHFAMLNSRDGFFLAGRRPDPIFSWKKLEGKTVLVDHFFQPLAMFKDALRRQGVDAAKVRIVDAGEPAAIEAAFRRGEGDFVHMQGPPPQQLEAEGLAQVLTAVGATVGPICFSTLAAAPAFLATPAAPAVLRALQAARRQAQQDDPAAIAAAITSLLPGVPLPTLATTVADYQRLGCWSGAEEITPALYDETVALFQRSGGLAGKPDPKGILGKVG